MKHFCHWPGCLEDVPPKMWGCKEHWFMLPKFLRDQIWKTYVPGQEKTKTPSAEYVIVVGLVRLWIVEFEKTGKKMSEKEFCGEFITKIKNQHRFVEIILGKKI